jgi:hypothetical protein
MSRSVEPVQPLSLGPDFAEHMGHVDAASIPRRPAAHPPYQPPAAPVDLEGVYAAMALPLIGERCAYVAIAAVGALAWWAGVTIPWVWVPLLVYAAGKGCWQAWYRRFTPTDQASRRRGAISILTALGSAAVTAAIQFGWLAR